jgi:hypothetical protein
MLQQPLVIAYHLIWTAYGWWLPNDPRGSGSKAIASEVVAELGELHYGRKRLQPAGSTVREFYDKAAEVLRFPLLTFDEVACVEIGQAFGQAIQQQRYTCYACAIMPDHVHVLLRKHKHQAEDMTAALKEASRARLVATEPSHLDWWQRLVGVPGSSRRNPPHGPLHRTKPGQDRLARAVLAVRQGI